MDKNKARKNSNRKELMEWVQAFVIAVVLALLIRGFVFEIVQVDKTSMVPTLEPRDRLISLKITYKFGEPERGDIITFKAPGNNGEIYIKRLIALPGDIVEIYDNMVFINGKELNEPYINEPTKGEYYGQVPEDSFFAMGDNRNKSLDSRDPSVGFIPMDSLLGKAKIRVWPFDAFAVFE